MHLSAESPILHKYPQPRAEKLHPKVKTAIKRTALKSFLKAPNSRPLIQVSDEALERMDTLLLLSRALISSEEARGLLNISRSQLYKLKIKYRRFGRKGPARQPKGGGNRACAPDMKKQILDIIREHYRDYGPTLISELLREEHGIKQSRETIRQWMIQAGLWILNRSARKRFYQPPEEGSRVWRYDPGRWLKP